jgi:cell division protein ZapD
LEPLLFIKKSIDFILHIIRKSGNFIDKLAEKGFYIEKLDPKKNILLIRITLTSDLYYYPQISVGKQRLNIMFMSKDDKNNLIRHKDDVQFILTTCVL